MEHAVFDDSTYPSLRTSVVFLLRTTSVVSLPGNHISRLPRLVVTTALRPVSEDHCTAHRPLSSASCSAHASYPARDPSTLSGSHPLPKVRVTGMTFGWKRAAVGPRLGKLLRSTVSSIENAWRVGTCLASDRPAAPGDRRCQRLRPALLPDGAVSYGRPGVIGRPALGVDGIAARLRRIWHGARTDREARPAEAPASA